MSATNSGKESGGKLNEVLEPSVRMKKLIEMSHDITVDKNISISRYFNSGRELIKAASALKARGENEKAFVLYLRYTTLFIEKLIRHPEWAKADKTEKKLVRDECNRVLDSADHLKSIIMEKFTAEYENYVQTKGARGPPEHGVQKRSFESQGSAGNFDDIDKKFDFSQKPVAPTEGAFDPFNIEQLKQSFNGSGH